MFVTVWPDDFDDEMEGGPPPDPSLRTWRHPSEIAAANAAASRDAKPAWLSIVNLNTFWALILVVGTVATICLVMVGVSRNSTATEQATPSQSSTYTGFDPLSATNGVQGEVAVSTITTLGQEQGGIATSSTTEPSAPPDDTTEDAEATPHSGDPEPQVASELSNDVPFETNIGEPRFPSTQPVAREPSPAQADSVPNNAASNETQPRLPTVFASKIANIDSLPNPAGLDPGAYAVNGKRVTLTARYTVVDEFILSSAGAVAGHDTMALLADGQWFAVVVDGVDVPNDLALLEIPTNQTSQFLTAVGAQPKPVRRDDIAAEGDTVQVHTIVDGTNVIRTGTILAMDQRVMATGPVPVYDALATSMTKGEVSAGAPLIRNSRVIGMVLGTSQYLTTAAPIGRLVEAANNMADHGVASTEWIGVRATSRPQGGVVVDGVTRSSPASRAGLRRDDIIRTVSGIGVVDASHLAHLIRQAGEGNTIDIEITRSGGNRTLAVTVGTRR